MSASARSSGSFLKAALIWLLVLASSTRMFWPSVRAAVSRSGNRAAQERNGLASFQVGELHARPLVRKS